MAERNAATRKRKDEKQPRRNIGRTFAFAMVFILCFALLYTFVFTNQNTLTPGDNEIIVAFLDVGQGDSILIWSRENAILIDGGDVGRQNVILRYLRQAGISRLDYVIASHPHRDHIGGLVAVLSRIEVGQVLMPDVVHTTTTFENFIEVIENNQIPAYAPSPGQNFRAGIIKFTVLAPLPGGIGLNDNSIILRLTHGETSFIFTGDAEAGSERALVASGQNINSDVIKIGHHGSRTSTTEAFIDAVAPVVAVITVGAGNQFGHPHEEVLARLTDRGISVYRTDTMGTIKMASNGTQIVMLE